MLHPPHKTVLIIQQRRPILSETEYYSHDFFFAKKKETFTCYISLSISLHLPPLFLALLQWETELGEGEGGGGGLGLNKIPPLKIMSLEAKFISRNGESHIFLGSLKTAFDSLFDPQLRPGAAHETPYFRCAGVPDFLSSSSPSSSSLSLSPPPPIIYVS